MRSWRSRLECPFCATRAAVEWQRGKTVARKCKQEAKAQQAVLPLMGPDAAGIDIGATEIWGWPCRHFPTFTQDLYGYADWLKQVRSEDRADVLGKSP